MKRMLFKLESLIFNSTLFILPPSSFRLALHRTSTGLLCGIKSLRFFSGLKKMLASIEPVETC